VSFFPSSDGSTVIHLVRHGQTVLNSEVRFRGRRDVPLNDIGRREALEAARTLGHAGIEAVYASPLSRALEVGTAIAGAAGLDDVHQWDGLVNLDYGRWEGLTAEQSREIDPDEWERYRSDPEEARCPDGERLAAAADRIVRALHDLAKRHPGGTIAAVSHGVMLRLAVLRVVGASPERDWQFRIPTGGSLIFTERAGELRLASSIPTESRESALATPENA
jgi:broad specificity phosphatase PhoE